MIIDKRTNTVFFSDLLRTKFKREFESIGAILKQNNIEYHLLTHTKDIWCRDYMPIQINKEKFIQFKYDPSYLNTSLEYQKLKSIPESVCKNNNLFPIFSDINLDGGNIVKWTYKVILTNRIFEENKNLSKEYILNELQNLFDAEIIIVPQINCDLTGHVDGMLRFFNFDTILINELKNEHKYWRKEILKSIKENNFNYIEVPWFEDKRVKMKRDYPDSAIGLYINFLEIDNLIIIPKFEIPNNRDSEALSVFKGCYPGRVIEQVNINEIAKFGGLFNCISWNIYK